VGARERLRQRARLWQTTHPYGRLARPVGAAHAEPPPILGHLDDAEVYVPAEASIQAHLFFGVGASALHGHEVQKAKIDRYLELVGVWTRQYNLGAVCLM
jgi:hypothetical protein